MPRNDIFRDYLYVSARKVIRMSRTLRPAAWKRVRDLQLKLGPVGATLKLGPDSHAEDVISLVPEVERAIDEHFGIRYLTDPGLQAGHWFMVDGVPMTYGVPGNDVGGVLFIGEAGRQFILGGSAEYLLDRKIAEEKSSAWGYSASHLGGIRNLLLMLAEDDLHHGPHLPKWVDSSRMDRRKTRIQRSLACAAAEQYHFESIRKVFGTGRELFTMVARCLDIDDSYDKVTVVGTPLYVAFHVPD
jgi:hypothetical protein